MKSELPFILIVDDNENQRHLFRLLTDRLEIKAHIVEGGAEALEALESYKFDAILMDVRMAVMDGMECTRKIREFEKSTGQHVPIMAATACVIPGDKERILGSGMDDYLSKPFTLQQLKEMLNKWTSTVSEADVSH